MMRVSIAAFIVMLLQATTTIATSEDVLLNKEMEQSGGLRKRQPEAIRKLSASTATASNSVKDLCDFYHRYGSPDPLPVTIARGGPDVLYRIEKGEQVPFVFNTYGVRGAVITILDESGI